MTKEERNEYQRFATVCMRNKNPVRFNAGVYIVSAIIYRLRDRTFDELFTVELTDINRKDSTITVGLEEFYITNHSKEDTKIE